MALNTKQVRAKVRISMPAEIANDLDAFKKGVRAFAEELGCPQCFSGIECTFESEREFRLSPDFEVKQLELADERSTFGGGGGSVDVRLTPEAEFDIDAILKSIDILGRRIGGHWEQGGQALCCSGYDPTFGRESDIEVFGPDFPGR